MHTSSAPADPLAAFLTLKEAARQLGSYYVAYSLHAAGLLGEPVKIGLTLHFPRDIAEPAIRRRCAQRWARNHAASIGAV